jgi:hypothetical protein
MYEHTDYTGWEREAKNSQTNHGKTCACMVWFMGKWIRMNAWSIGTTYEMFYLTKNKFVTYR